MRSHVAELIDAIREHARIMYQFGRSDRINGFSVDPKLRHDMYYVRAYNSERAKEHPSATR